MGGVDAQFAEDVFAVGGDGVDAGETFGSSLLGRLALSDGADYLRLRLGQDAGTFFLNLLLVDDNLCRSESPEQIRESPGLLGIPHFFCTIHYTHVICREFRIKPPEQDGRYAQCVGKFIVGISIHDDLQLIVRVQAMQQPYLAE